MSRYPVRLSGRATCPACSHVRQDGTLDASAMQCPATPINTFVDLRLGSLFYVLCLGTNAMPTDVFGPRFCLSHEGPNSVPY